jgi:glutaredoxin-related protein
MLLGLDRLLGATSGLSADAYSHALRDELKSMGQDAQTPDSLINGRLTGGCDI